MYDANEAATRLGVKPATLQYWHRMLGDMSPAAAADDGTLLFNWSAMDTFGWLKQVIIEEHWSLTRARDALGRRGPSAPPPPRPSAAFVDPEPLTAAISALHAEMHVLAEESKQMHRLLAHIIDVVTKSHQSPAALPRPPQLFRIVQPQPDTKETRPRHNAANGKETSPWPTQPPSRRPSIRGLP